MTLSKPRSIVDAAWADYCQRAEIARRGESVWQWSVDEIRKRYGYRRHGHHHDDRLYQDFTKCGYTVRRSTGLGKRARGTDQPPCPGVNVFCRACNLLPVCKDWHCYTCDQVENCPCWLPKSQRWLGAWWAFEIERENNEKLFDMQEALYGKAIDQEAGSRTSWIYTEGNTCRVCDHRIANESVLCRKHRPRVRGLCQRLGISEEAAIEMCREDCVD